MKKTSADIKSITTLLFVTVMVVLLQSSCKKSTTGGVPVITGFRAYNKAPNDTVLTKIVPGSYIVIQGSHLSNMQYVLFDGFPASINSSLGSDNSFAVQVPSTIPFATIATDQFNTVKVITSSGSVTYSFPIIAPTPVISSVSNEMANPGDVITLYGTGLFAISNITFPGSLPGTNIKADPTGTFATVQVPAGFSQAGPLNITTKYGTSSSVLRVNDQVTGMLCNFDNVNNYNNGATIKNDGTLFPGSRGNYAELNTAAPLGAYDYNQGSPGHAINLNAVQWVPQSNLRDPISSYALKFEINVIKPWSGGTIMIRRDENTWLFLARYEPWKNAPALTFTTTGWTTVVIPLTNFKGKASGGEGTGNSAPDLTTLINSTGNRPMTFMLINDTGTAGATIVDAAVDNIRIVKSQ